jgi:parvulin-like peptidyl-prolyl isomerase
MKFCFQVLAVILAGALGAAAQQAPATPVSSHKPVVNAPAMKMAGGVAASAKLNDLANKPAARVNGAVITELDVLREMYIIFPYAQQHNGFPKNMESEIRRGALDMVIFEELLYQEAKRRNLAIPAERLTRAEVSFRNQFSDSAAYQNYLRTELHGSKAAVRERIRRSLLIDRMMKLEIEQKSAVTPLQTRQYYERNPKLFQHGETIAIQTISIIPPENATPAMQKEAQAKIKDIVRLTRPSKTPREFGLIAEQVSEDDWRMKMGDRGTLGISQVPPEIARAARAMKPGQVSDAIQIGRAYVVIRLNARTLAGKSPFSEVKAKLQSDLQREKVNEVRAALAEKLRGNAKIEKL